MSTANALAEQPHGASRRKTVVREATLDDYKQLRTLLSGNDLETKSFDEWSDLWAANPIYRERQGQWAIGWVLETDEKELVGFLGNIPLAYILNGQRLIAAVTHAWAVAPQYRGYALLLLDHYFSQPNVDLYLSTTVNALASQAFTTFGSQRVPVGSWDQSFFWIGNHQGFARSWLQMKQAPFPDILSTFFAAALWSKTRQSRRAVNATRNVTEVEVCGSFDDRFAAFWKALLRKEQGSLLAVRTQEALNWHFYHARLQQKLSVVAVTQNSSLLSYAVFLRQDNARFGLERVRLVDFQTLKEDGSDLVPMLAWAVRNCRERNIDMLECVDWGLSSAVGRLAPATRRLPCWMYYYKAKSRSLARILASPNAWKPTPFDGDSSL